MSQHASTTDHKAAAADAPKDARPDIRGILEGFKLPGFDFDAFVESRKLDIDVVTQTTAATFTGVRTIADKQGELLKSGLNEVGAALRAVPSDVAKSTGIVRKQRDLVRDGLSSALASMKEIAEAARKSQSEVIEIASGRVRCDVEEIRRLANRPHEKTAK
jgi:phasin family protein